MPAIIEIDRLRKSFGKYHIIDDLVLSIEAGSVFGLVGMNGAGKTTLLRLLLGLLKPDAGTVRISAHTPWNHASAFYQSSGVVLEHDGFWGNLTARENCALYAAAKGVSPQSLNRYLETWWNDSELFKGKKKVKHFSRGQRMQCALCRAFMGKPQYLFLDEPVIALDLNGYNHFKMLVNHARERGAALIISSHQLDTIDELCERAGILQDGRITEISHRIHGAAEEWFIDADINDTTTGLLVECGVNAVICSDGYRFSLTDGKRLIPDIIRKLVLAGVLLREVKRRDNDFSSIIQMYYSNNGRMR